MDTTLSSQWRVVREMLSDRGYVIVPMEFPVDATRDELTIRTQHADTKAPVLVLFYAPPSPSESVAIGIDAMRHLVTTRVSDGCTHLIMVFPTWSHLTPPARAHVEELNRKGDFTLEVFTEAELAVNVTRHTRVAKKRRMATVKRVGERYVPPPPHTRRFVTPHLPCIDAKLDPVARYHGHERDEAMTTERASETAGCYQVHRVGI